MLTSTSAVHCLRKLEKMTGLPYDLKNNADVLARVLKMRVSERPDPENDMAMTAFLHHLRSVNVVQQALWFNGEYLAKKITIQLLKRAL